MNEDALAFAIVWMISNPVPVVLFLLLLAFAAFVAGIAVLVP